MDARDGGGGGEDGGMRGKGRDRRGWLLVWRAKDRDWRETLGREREECVRGKEGPLGK